MAGAGDGVMQKFTGKERDIETGSDDFKAMHYASPGGDTHLQIFATDPSGAWRIKWMVLPS